MKLLTVTLLLFSMTAMADQELSYCGQDPKVTAPLLQEIPARLQPLMCSKIATPADPFYLGTNCFGAVMMWLDPSAKPVFVGHFAKILAEQFVQIDRAQLAKNDILVIGRDDLQDEDGGPYLLHAAVYLGDGWLWNKLGPDKFATDGDGNTYFAQPDWTFSKMQEVIDYYDDLNGATPRYFRKK